MFGDGNDKCDNEINVDEAASDSGHFDAVVLISGSCRVFISATRLTRTRPFVSTGQ